MQDYDSKILGTAGDIVVFACTLLMMRLEGSSLAEEITVSRCLSIDDHDAAGSLPESSQATPLMLSCHFVLSIQRQSEGVCATCIHDRPLPVKKLHDDLILEVL